MKSCCSNREETFSAIIDEISQNSVLLALFITIFLILVLILWSRGIFSRNTENTESGTFQHSKME